MECLIANGRLPPTPLRPSAAPKPTPKELAVAVPANKVASSKGNDPESLIPMCDEDNFQDF